MGGDLIACFEYYSDHRVILEDELCNLTFELKWFQLSKKHVI